MHPRSIRRLFASALLTLASTLPAGGCGGDRARPSAAGLVVIETSALPRAIAGSPYETEVAATGPNPPLVYLVSGGRLPDGLALDSATGRVAGWPRAAGRHRVEIEVRDGAGAAGARDASFAAARRAFDVVVDAGPLTILPFAPPPSEYGASFAHRFEAAGGEAPYRFEVASGSLPAGLSIAPDGMLSGAPSAAASPYRPRVEVTDARGARASREFELRVVVAPLVIATRALADAAVNAPYDATPTLLPVGAGAPFHWSIESGAPPPGIALDPSSGRLHGRATATGDFAFRLAARDALGQTAQRDLVLHVHPGPVLTSVSPSRSGRVDARITLVGQAFQPGMTVAFGVASPVAATVTDPTRASVVASHGPAQSGPVAVRIENPDGGWFEKEAGFRFPWRDVQFVADGVRGGARDHARGLAAGDVDGDGLCDLAHVGSAGIEVVRPVGPTYHGAWTTKVVRSDGAFNDVRLADVDADGDLDLVVTRSSTTDTIEVYKNDGAGGFPSTASAVTTYPRPSAFHYPFGLATGDVDADGLVDVALTSGRGNQGTLWIYRGLGDGSFTLLHEAAGTIFEAAGGCFGPNSVELADLDGDGRDDVVVSDAFPAACAPGQTCPSTAGANEHAGAPDFAAWTALCGPGGTPTGWSVARLSGRFGRLDGDNTGLAVYDHDGDGRLDLAVFGGYLNQRGQGVAFLAGDGRGRFTERMTVPTLVNRRFGARLDANGDGCDALCRAHPSWHPPAPPRNPTRTADSRRAHPPTAVRTRTHPGRRRLAPRGQRHEPEALGGGEGRTACPSDSGNPRLPRVHPRTTAPPVVR